jgi:type II secretory pathway pseudopilin PulG
MQRPDVAPGCKVAAIESPMISGACPVDQRGFTYLVVIFLVALLGVTSLATGLVWRFEQQRAREAELVFIGREFARAIASYRAVAETAPQPWPRTLDALLRDSRSQTVRRHLRKIYRDPFTHRAEWGLIRTPDGGIVGVYSLGAGRPIRRVEAPGLTVRGNATYEEWLFLAEGAPGVVRDARQGIWMASAPPVKSVPGAPVSRPGEGAAQSIAGGDTSSSPAASAAAGTSIGAAAGSSAVTGSTTPSNTPPRKAAPRTDCARLARNDASTCTEVTARFDAESGAACQASAQARAAQCESGQDITVQLAVRYF